MGKYNSGVTDDSITVEDYSDDDGATTETDIEVPKPVGFSPVPDCSPFVVDEKVLVFHSLQIYEAKVLEVEFEDKEWSFFVHYQGWNKTWDEWVGMDRLMKYTEENVRKQKELDEIHRISNGGRSSQIKPRNSSVTRRKKRKRRTGTKGNNNATLDNQISVHIPSALKKLLVDDCDSIIHLGKVMTLPRTPTVGDILDKYRDDRLKEDTSIADSLGEILNGLRCYFDKALPILLLYGRERQQYEEAIVDGVSPSNIYGAEHLLRLFVKLPEMLYSIDIDKEALIELQLQLVDFLKFMQTNRSDFFQSAYQTVKDLEPKAATEAT